MTKPQHTKPARVVRGASFLAVAALAAGCTTSLLRYASIHVDDAAGSADGGVGAQVYGLDDTLGVARAVAPPNILRRSPDDDVFEIRSWKVDTAAATQRVATLSARDASAGDGGALVTIITKERCAGQAGVADAGPLLEAMRDAGHPVGYDLTVATVEGDDTAAAEAFQRAAREPTSATTGSDLHTALDGWRASVFDEPTSLTPRTGDERVMAAAYDLALAYRLSNGADESPIFASIALLRAPTQALQLDILRLLASAPVARNASTWTLMVAPKTRSLDCPPEDSTPLPQDARELARFIARTYVERPADAARALELAAQLAAHKFHDGLVGSATSTFLRAAEVLYARDVCKDAQRPRSAAGERRCHAAVAALDTGKDCR